MQARQAQVEDDQVELVGRQRGVGFAAAAHLVNGIAGRAQRAQQAVGQHLVVFGNEDTHGLVSSRLGTAWWPRGGLLFAGRLWAAA